MALRQWDGDEGNGLWSFARNWDNDTPLADNDDIQIGAGFGTTIFNGQINGQNTLTIGTLTSQSALEVSAGTLTATNTFDVDDNLTISNGTLELNGTSTVNTFTQTGGTLQGSGVLTISGNAEWDGGNQRGTGITEVDGTLTFGGVGQKILGGSGESRTLEINNGAIWNTTSSLFLQGDSIINNNTGSTFDIQEDSTGFIGIFNSIGTNNTFNNAGTLVKSAGDDRFIIDIVFNNTGTVQATNGILDLGGGGDHSGDFEGTATLEFGGGTHNLNSGSSVTASDVDITGGTVNVNTGATYNTNRTDVSFGTWEIANAATIGTGSQSGGTITGAGNLQVTGDFDWNGGNQNGTGTTEVDGTLTFGGTGQKILGAFGESRTLDINNGAIWETTGNLLLQGGSIINNNVGSTFNIQEDSTGFIGILNGGAGGGTFNNAGTLVKSAGDDRFAIDIVFNNTGTVQATNGILDLGGGGDHSGDFEGTATLEFGGGTHNLNSGSSVTASDVDITGGTVNVNTGATYNTNRTDVSFGTWEIANAATIGTGSQSGGTITGAGNLQVTGDFDWNGGNQNGTGTTEVDGTLTFGGTGQKILGAFGESRTLDINNGAIWETTGNLLLQGGSIINNNVGSTFNIQEDSTGFIGILNGGAGGGTFNNAGTLVKSAGDDRFAIDIVFNNTGTVQATNGILDLGGGGDHSGDFEGTATLEFGGGTHNLNSGSSVTASDVDITGGTVNVNTGATYNTNRTDVSFGTWEIANAATIGTGSQSGGTITGAGNLQVTGDFDWNGGNQNGTGTTEVDGTLTFGGTGQKILGAFGESRTLDINNGAIWETTGNLLLQGGSIINNNVGSTFNIQEDSTGFIGILNGGAGGGTFNNAGTLVKSAGDDRFAIDIVFNNTGTVQATNGILDLGGGGDHSGDFEGTATLEFGGGTHNLSSNTTVSVPNVIFSAGTTNLAGDYVLPSGGTTTVSGGTANFTGTITGNSIGDVTLSFGTLNLSTGSAVTATSLVQTGGTLTGSDDLTVTGDFDWNGGNQNGTGTTEVDGTLTFGGTGQKILGAFGESRTLDINNGAIWETTGNLLLQGGSIINNNVGSTFNIQEDSTGFIGILNGGAGGGTFNNAGTLVKSAGDDRFAIDIVFNNTGTVQATNGILDLGGGGDHSGDFEGTATLEFGGGTHNLSSNTTVSVPNVIFSAGTTNLAGDYVLPSGGTTTVSGGTANFTGTITGNSIGDVTLSFGTLNLSTGSAVTATSLVQTGGTLTGSDDLTVTGDFDWNGGNQNGTGTTEVDGTLTFGGTGQKILGAFGESRTLDINNGAIWETTGNLLLQGGSIINNNVGSTFNIQEDSTGFIGILNGGAGGGTFNNAGTLVKSAGDDNFTINIDFNNTGTVSANNGILTFSDNYTQSAGDTRLDGGSIVVSSNPLDINAGNVSGFGSIDGDIDNDAGRITPGLSVGDIAMLNITGDYSETDFSNIDIEIGGLTNFDILDIDGTATLDGTVNVSLVNGFTPTLGQTFEIITFDSAPDIATNLSFSGLDIGGGLAFAPVFNTNDLSLVVVETAALSVSDVIISEGDNGTTNATFNVTLNGETDAFDVDFATVDSTATVADGDYIANSGTLSFDGTDGQTRTVTVQVNGDNKVELNETFDLVLSNLQGNGTLPVLVSGTGTINNDDSANISIDNVTQSEGNNGTTPFTFTVTLNNEVDTGLSVDFATANGSATVANNDYQATNGTLNFTGNAGETQTITVDVVGDTTVEPDETFVVNLNNLQANGRNIILSDSQGIGTIENDDGANLSITNVNLVEGDNGTQQFVFSVTLSNTISGGATVDFTTADNTATTTDNDYTATSGTLTFSGNAGEVETITVDVIGDTEVELNETFLVNLSNASSGVTIADGQGTGTIVNDDAASLSISDVTLSEGNNGTQLYTFTVTLDEAVDTGFTVDYATANNTASIGDGDYTAVNGTLSFDGNAGETQTITVEVNGDNKVELDETFFVNLSNLQNSGRNVVITDGQGVGTISNDDSASLSINNVTQSEGNSGTTAYTFDVTLDNEVDTGLSLDFDTADNTATVADNDYTANSGTLNFTGNAGEVQTITVEVNGDTKVEPNEAFLVNLSNLNANGRDVTISDAQGIGTIENDDGAGFSISNATVTEGDNGTQTLTFDVTLNNAVSGGASVDFDTADGTATTADGDYTANSGTLTFAGNAGETQTITVEVNGDNKVELNETILVNLSNAIGADIVDGQGTGTIVNDDSASLSINNVTQSEGNSNTTIFTFDVTLDNAVDTGLSLDFDTADNTATVADNDYTANSGTLNFTGNAGEVQTITVEVNGDTIVEPNEDFLVNLSNLNANGRDVTISDAQGIGTIENDDGAGFSISNATVTEGDNGTQTLTFDVTLNNAVSGGASVDFDTADGTATTADGDYTANSGTLTFAGNAGETQTITVEVNGDNKVELNETILVNLSNAIGADIVDGQGTGTIVNDDSASLSINNVTQSEGNSNTTIFTFDVTLDNAVDTGLSLDFDTADNTATVADNDYTANSGTLNFTGNAGEVQTITVEVNGDTIVEPNEDFLVNLSNLNANGRDVTISDAQGIGTIENDDGAGFSISNATVTEGDNGTQTLTFDVTLNNAVSGGASVDFDTADGTATTADGDYTANSGTLTFAGNAGETQTITVEVNGDNKVELNETILVNLSNAIGADILDGQGTGTINNDDSASISINNVSQAEGNSNTTIFTFDVTLDNAVDTGLSLDFDTADDTATVADNDYTANNGTLNFTGNAGEVQTLTVEVNGDTIVEPNEDFLVNLSNLNANGRDVTISEAQGIGTIENDDGAGFSISNATVTEGDNGTQTLTFDVTLNNAVSGGASVDFDTADGTATTADGDYTANSGTLTFAGNAGETQTITVEVNGDNKVELNETILVNLSNAIGADIVDGQGTGTIVNDDSASLSINNVTQSEGNSGTTAYTFDVTLDNEVDTGLSLDFDTADDTATVADNDYTANNGTLNFTGNAGEVQTLTVEVNGDTIVEPNEDFLVNLSNLNANGRDVTISEAQGIGTIENDDVPSGPIEINGTPGRDNLIGTAESEIITGFAGSDMLTGMGGGDVFAFQNVDDGLDLISDFELGLDVIDLSQLLSNDTDFNPFGQNPLDLGYVQIGSFAGFTTIGIDIDGSAGANSYVRTLAVVQGTGVDPNTLNDPNNFIFASALD
ncbi:hypothetical protein cce_5280 (plasmid) [Crocosphaera subtropica ATCC 51142]|uniref:Calx-beta domain-containing protein n=1 Tax=Crocosphaera subtropica (strain ATCC 51142 / BH68) TaxID=43989 RepID=B1X3B5_CROS5|nr:Calx-beta domain-containing protein [Crocosphaera subtropica]ACB54626.1 hypothetical protein cce_5280 [Crocosphaera subtropica ATCC 51142]